MRSNIIGIIPARGGSKSIPNKNIKLLGGKPLMKYTIDAAYDSKLLRDFYISSENEKILALAKNFRVKTILRPTNLAEDSTPMVPVLKHAINYLEPKIGKIEMIILLQPTTPFKLGKDIDDAIKLLQNTGADSIISISKATNGHPAWMYYLKGNKVVPLWGEEYKFKRRQELPPLYLRNGVI